MQQLQISLLILLCVYCLSPKINLFESPEGDTKSDFSVQASMSGPSADTKSQSVSCLATVPL